MTIKSKNFLKKIALENWKVETILIEDALLAYEEELEVATDENSEMEKNKAFVRGFERIKEARKAEREAMVRFYAVDGSEENLDAENGKMLSKQVDYSKKMFQKVEDAGFVGKSADDRYGAAKLALVIGSLPRSILIRMNSVKIAKVASWLVFIFSGLASANAVANLIHSKGYGAEYDIAVLLFNAGLILVATVMKKYLGECSDRAEESKARLKEFAKDPNYQLFKDFILDEDLIKILAYYIKNSDGFYARKMWREGSFPLDVIEKAERLAKKPNLGQKVLAKVKNVRGNVLAKCSNLIAGK